MIEEEAEELHNFGVSAFCGSDEQRVECGREQGILGACPKA